MSDERDEIRLRTDIVDLVGQRVLLKRVGKHFTGLCPFHDDKKPSFSVDSSTGRYRCWSCNESGDVFTWVMKTENVDFPEALQILAQRAGIELTGRDRSASPRDKTQLQGAMTEALSFFREALSKDVGALEYCTRRGIDQATIDKWELGFAPAGGNPLATRLGRKKYPLSVCKELFLVDEDGSGGFYDKFRGRLMFPIYDERGNLVAFGGRVLDNGMPKYINSSDTPLYRKSRVLYGFNTARNSLTGSKKAVLVEGYLDVIACHRAGVDNAVASLGTALGEEHCRLLKRWCEQVTILYDSDPAGQKAAERAVPLLEAEGLRVKVALMPPGEDPDTLLRQQGAGAVVKSVEAGLTPTSFRLSQLDERLKPEDERYWEEAVSILSQAKENLEREEHLLKLAGKYPHIKDVRTALVRLTKMVDDAKKPAPNTPKQARQTASPEFMRVREPIQAAEMVIFGSLHEPAFQKSAWIALRTPEIFATGVASNLAAAVLAAFPNQPPEGPAFQWIDKIEPETMKQLLSDIHLDYQNVKLSEDSVIDSMNFLKTKAIERDLRRIRQGNLSAEERQEIYERIRSLKPDTRVSAKEDEEDPFS